MHTPSFPFRMAHVVLGILFMPGVLMAGLSGCGYTLVGGTSDARLSPIMLAVSPFTNQTREPDLASRMTASLRWAIVQNRAFDLATEVKASRHLYGSIRRFRTVPLSFDASDNVLQYRLEADVVIRLVETASKTTTFEHEISAWAEYLVSDTGVVRENVVAKAAALDRLSEQFASKCTAYLTIMLL